MSESPWTPEASLDAIVEAAVEAQLRREKDKYAVRLRYYMLGLGTVLALLLGTGLWTKGDIFRQLHSIAFPTPSPDEVVVSYEASFELTPEDEAHVQRTISFFAREGHEVHVFVTYTPRFGTPSGVTVRIDQEILEPAWDLRLGTRGFEQITEWIHFGRNQDVHSLSFQLEDPTDDNLDARLLVESVILVKGPVH